MESIFKNADLLPALRAQITDHLEAFIAALPALSGAIIVLLLTWLISALLGMTIRKLARRLSLRTNLSEVFQMLAALGVWITGILIAVMIVFPSVTPGRVLTTLGLGSVAVGLAFKDTFENFLAGLLILLREPFRIGDHVDCEGIEGQIEDITVRDTRIRRTDGQLVVMPNSRLFQNPVTVRTDRELRRTTIIVGIAYGEDVDAARTVIANAVHEVDSVRDDVRDVQVFAQEFNSSSVDFEVTWWTGSRPVDIRASRDQVVAAVKRALDTAGIEIPFPYQTITFKDRLETAPVSEDSD